MSLPQPNNEQEAAYTGFAIADELIDTLVKKGLISEPEAEQLIERVVTRLKQGNNHTSQRAARWLAGAR